MIFHTYTRLMYELRRGAVLSLTLVNKNRNVLHFGGNHIRPNQSLKHVPPFSDRLLADLERSWKLVQVSVELRKDAEEEVPAIHLDLDSIAERAGVDKASAALVLAEAQKQRDEILSGARIAKVAAAKIEGAGLLKGDGATALNFNADEIDEPFDVSDGNHKPAQEAGIDVLDRIDDDDESPSLVPAFDGAENVEAPVVDMDDLADPSEDLDLPEVEGDLSDLAPAAATAVKADAIAAERAANRKKLKKKNRK